MAESSGDFSKFSNSDDSARLYSSALESGPHLLGCYGNHCETKSIMQMTARKKILKQYLTGSRVGGHTTEPIKKLLLYLIVPLLTYLDSSYVA